MHSYDRMTGILCKCMDCARQRQDRLRIFATVESPDIHVKLLTAKHRQSQVRSELDRLDAQIARSEREWLDTSRELLLARIEAGKDRP